jgi:hypothetical protein
MLEGRSQFSLAGRPPFLTTSAHDSPGTHQERRLSLDTARALAVLALMLQQPPLAFQASAIAGE